jgi:peptidoglycan/LPS O-acetylase OafA/YrhL
MAWTPPPVNALGRDVHGGYRPALDGVRAVAILAVLGYHLGAGWLRGGFLGVDAFFVLSGYLITSILLDQHRRDHRIELAGFWARRARRLFPALLLLVIGVTLLVRDLSPVTEWPSRQADLLWTIAYGANWHQIASDQDYFAQFLTASPLRHMWSLAIEEQFYLVWPLVLLLVLRGRLARWLPALIGGGIAVSALVMAVLYDPSSQSRAYYGTDSRAQVILVGALLAVLVRVAPRLSVRVLAHAGPIGLAALGLVLGAMALATDRWGGYYHGGSVMFAAAVAALIWAIEARPGGLAARLLGAGVMRGIGRISYGLYLWHWPAILFTPLLLQQLLGTAANPILSRPALVAAVEVGAAVAVALLSYTLVERPIQRGTLPFRVSNLRVGIAVPATAIAAGLVVVTAMDVPAADIALIRGASTDCPAATAACPRHQAGTGRPVVALMGDSIALSLDPAFLSLAQRQDWTFVDAAHDRCSLLRHWVADPGTGGRLAGWDSCYAVVPAIQAAVLARRPNVIVASDRWLLIDSLDDRGRLLRAGTSPHIADTERRLDATVDQLTASGAAIVFLHLLPMGQPVQCADANPPLAYRAECSEPVSADRLTPLYNAMLDRVVARHPGHAAVIDLTGVVCPDGYCRPKVDGVWMRFDGLHFTVPGAQLVAPTLGTQLVRSGVGL